MASEGPPIGVPVLKDLVAGHIGARDREHNRDTELQGDDAPLRDADAMALRRRVAEAANIQDDGQDPVASWRHACPHDVRQVHEEGDDLGEGPRDRENHHHDENPDAPRVRGVRIQTWAGHHVLDAAACDNGLDHISDHHVGGQAGRRRAEAGSKGDVVRDHASDAVTLVVVPSKADDEEGNCLEGQRVADIGLRELGRVAHL
mmetsp:Transcript_88612/g.228537  ORF Transcript_88612/g.228537 Transcript_88612/m.228537 type:complete len:203 (-) Transcript_88612:827-1435(-)